MGLRIVYGKSGSGKSEFCFSEISKLLNTQENILIITPEQFSFTAEKKLMQIAKNKSVINTEVITLSRMAHRVMQEVGNVNVSNLSCMLEDNTANAKAFEKNKTKSSLSKSAKAMLIHSIIENNKKELKFLGKSDENIDLAMQAITEFKKHQITVDMINQKIDLIESKYLQTKINDMKLIYEKFENTIKEQFIDDTDLLTYLENNIEKTNIVNNSLIYIDEFMGFTKQEYAILAKLIKLAKQVTLTICTDTLAPSANPVSDIFYSNKKTLSKILRTLEDNNLKLEEPIQLEELHRFKNNELKELENGLFNVKSTIYEKNVENIELFLAKNQYSEIENVATNITNLVKKDNYRYKDISIITKNLAQYSSLIRAIFEKYNIPVFIDEKRDLNQNIIIKYFLCLLDVINRNFSYESVISYIKSGFLEYDKEDIFELENYCIKWGIKFNKWKKDFIFERETKREDVDKLNTIRKEIINPLIDLKTTVSKEKTAEGISKAIYSFVINQGIEEKLKTKIEELNQKGMLDLVAEYKKSYEIIINLLDDIVDIFGNSIISIEKYIECFRVGLKHSSLGKIPGTQDQVIVGDIERSRSHKVKAIFIVGINDGSFPSNNKDEGFFNDKDREVLKENDLELANGTMENLYEENFNIYKAFTTAEEKLFLSYASSDSTGKSLRPSMMISNIKKLFPKLKEESDVIEKKYEIINSKITYEELLENISKLQDNEKIDDIWYLVYNYYKEKNIENLNNDLTGLKYTNIPKTIEEGLINKLYGNTLKTSVSKLERYRSCPFSYYLQYGLNIKEKEELKVQSFNTGSFMHETIDSFFKYVKEENIPLPTLLEDTGVIEKFVSKIIEEELQMNKNIIFTTTAKYHVLVKRLKRIITKALKYIIESLVYSEFEIEGTEIEFGKNEDYEPIVLNLQDGKKVEITGKIDRIDTAQNEERKIFKNNRL